VIRPLTKPLSYLLDLSDKSVSKLDDLLCFNFYGESDYFVRNNLFSNNRRNVRTILDFGFDFGVDLDQDSMRKHNSKEITQEQEILDQVGIALENGDILSQV
jgi:hypothetical protein